MGLVRAHLGLVVEGRLRLTLRDAQSDEVLSVREGPNLLVNSGLNALSQTLGWTFFQNQNASWSNPFGSTYGNLGDVWGALGSSTTAADPSQTQLVAEFARAKVTAATAGTSTLSGQFYFPPANALGTVNEAGVFLQANQVLTTLGAALSSGTIYTSLTVASLPATIPAGATLILGYTTGTTQVITASATAALGATTISVNSFTANANYASGASVAYNTGILLDRLVFISPTNKTNAMTATLELTLTLQSG